MKETNLFQWLGGGGGGGGGDLEKLPVYIHFLKIIKRLI